MGGVLGSWCWTRPSWDSCHVTQTDRIQVDTSNDHQEHKETAQDGQAWTSRQQRWHRTPLEKAPCRFRVTSTARPSVQAHTFTPTAAELLNPPVFNLTMDDITTSSHEGSTSSRSAKPISQTQCTVVDVRGKSKTLRTSVEVEGGYCVSS